MKSQLYAHSHTHHTAHTTQAHSYKTKKQTNKQTDKHKTKKPQHDIYLTDNWTLAHKLKMPRIQLTNHMKIKNKEDQNVDPSILLGRGSKLITGGRGRK